MNILVHSMKDKIASDVLVRIVGVVEVDLHRSISHPGKSQKVDLRLPDDGTIEGQTTDIPYHGDWKTSWT